MSFHCSDFLAGYLALACLKTCGSQWRGLFSVYMYGNGTHAPYWWTRDKIKVSIRRFWTWKRNSANSFTGEKVYLHPAPLPPCQLVGRPHPSLRPPAPVLELNIKQAGKSKGAFSPPPSGVRTGCSLRLTWRRMRGPFSLQTSEITGRRPKSVARDWNRWPACGISGQKSNGLFHSFIPTNIRLWNIKKLCHGLNIYRSPTSGSYILLLMGVRTTQLK